MPRQKPFNKKTSTTYALVHRPQNDPLINDSDASQHVFAQISGPAAASQSPGSSSNRSKVKQRGDLEDEFGIAFKDNEGEAAEQGIYYDDTSYDYMQHMRELGNGAGEATWIEAPKRQGDRKRKDKQSLEDALREASLDDDDDLQSVGGASYASMTTGKSIARPKYEAQQEIPDAIAGFQPNMDPRLREVLEALEDEAYVEEEDDFFANLANEGGEEVDQDEFEAQLFDDEDDWQSETTERPTKEYNDHFEGNADDITRSRNAPESLPPPDSGLAPPPPDSTTDGEWLASFAKSKATGSAPTAFARGTPSEAPSATLTSATAGRRKKRKGALTNASGFSMTSSALARTEAMSLLDERFERIADSYMNDIPEGEDDEFDDTASNLTGLTTGSRMTAKSNATWKTGMTGRSNASRASAWGGSQFGGSQASQAPQLVPAGFDAMLDEFMGGVGGHGRGKRMKKGGKAGVWGQQTGLEQLDEIRSGLGKARVSERYKAKA